MVTKTLLTAEDLLELPYDGRRYELLDGELKELPLIGFKAATAQSRITRLLGDHVEERDLGEVASGDPGIILRRNPDRVRGPDVAFFSKDRVPAVEPDTFVDVVPDFLVEVISPNDKAFEVQDKIEEWLRAGVRLVWAVYPSTRSVVAYRSPSDIRLYGASDTITGEPALPEFACEVWRFFGRNAQK